MKRILYFSISILALSLLGTNARAADTTCGITGIVDGGASYQGGNVTVTSGPSNLVISGNFLGFGETAIGYGCNNWMAQLDGAFYHSGFSNNGIVQANGQDNQGHIGGAIMWRDLSVGRVGLAGSEILNNTHLVGLKGFSDVGGSLTRIGTFGDFYASDAITLGAGGFYVTGNPINAPGAATILETGFEGNIHAKFYATDNISLGLQGDIQAANLTALGQVIPWNGYVGSAEAEYLVPNTSASLLLGGRVASRNYTEVGTTVTINDQQAYIGVKWAFGGPISSLRARDRAGTYDNTSVFDEKLPQIYYDEENALTH